MPSPLDEREKNCTRILAGFSPNDPVHENTRGWVSTRARVICGARRIRPDHEPSIVYLSRSSCHKYAYTHPRLALSRMAGRIGATWGLCETLASASLRSPFSYSRKERRERPRGRPSGRTLYFIRIEMIRLAQLSAGQTERERERGDKRRGGRGEIGPLGENQENPETRTSQERGGEESGTSFVTLTLDEDLFHRDVRNDGRDFRTIAAGMVNVILKWRRKLSARCVTVMSGQ